MVYHGAGNIRSLCSPSLGSVKFFAAESHHGFGNTGEDDPTFMLILMCAFVDAGTGLENQFTGEEWCDVLMRARWNCVLHAIGASATCKPFCISQYCL